MLTFSQTPENALKIDYDNIVTDDNMRSVLKYRITTGKVWYDRKGKTMVKKSRSEVVATGPKKIVKPKTDAPKLKKVDKQTTISRAGDRTPIILAKVIVPESRSTEASRKDAPTASASIAPLESTKLTKESAKASGKEVPPALPEDRPTGVAPAPGSDVIEIEDEPEESEKEVPLVRSATKRKEKMQGSSKRTRFTSDP
jgi:hypothetical protein